MLGLMESTTHLVRALLAAGLWVASISAQIDGGAALQREPETEPEAEPEAEHWAFRAPRPAAEVPAEIPAEITADGWSRRGVIDRFILARMRAEGLEPSPRADRRTLIRRLSLDLTGLPPTREEIAAFVADRRPEAYEHLVDGLLARDAYGEHMARYWLDVVRYADTNGIHHDHYREFAPYRDWVIRAYRDNMPFDRFVEAQLAGDLGDDPSLDDRIASGYHRLHLIIDRGTALPEESHARNVFDRVAVFGTAFLGLTVHCAQCHDHKYDPVSQADYYRLAAFFNNLDGAPETGGRGTSDFRRGLQPPYIDMPDETQAARLAELDAEISGLDPGADADKARLRELRQQRNRVLRTVPAAMVMKERSDVRPTHVFVRGDYRQLGVEVARGTPAFLPPLETDEPIPTRRDLARWLTAPEHPLTARVAVNRLWQQIFGVGLVATSEDFGVRGERPSHPGLLDHLAHSFVASGWNVKALLREIVLSETYRQVAAAAPAAFERDPDNRLLARSSRYRLDAEVIRDQILATSGLLDTTMFGPSVKPPQPPGIWKAVTLPDSLPRVFVADEGPAIYRRSVYTFWKRGMPPPQMTLLNAPTREFCTARRERTNTPLQALLLLNETEYLRAARHLAHRTRRREQNDAACVGSLFEAITARVIDEDERATLLACLDDLRQSYAASPELAASLCEGCGLDGIAAPELAAWTMVTSAIYNLDIVRTRP